MLFKCVDYKCLSRSAGQHVPLGFTLQRTVQLEERHNRVQRRLLLEPAIADLHIHGFEHIYHLLFAPEQFIIAPGRNGNEHGHIEQVFIVISYAVLDKVPSLDGVGQFLIVGAGVLHTAQFGAVEPDTLGHLVNSAAPVLPAHMHVHVNTLARIDKRGHPPGPHHARIAVVPYIKESVVQAIHDGIVEVGQVNAPGGQEVGNMDFGDWVYPDHLVTGCHGVQHYPVCV